MKSYFDNARANSRTGSRMISASQPTPGSSLTSMDLTLGKSFVSKFSFFGFYLFIQSENSV